MSACGLAPEQHKRAIMLGIALAAGANTSFLAFMVIAQFDACANVMLVKRRRKSLEAVLAQCESGLLAINLC